MQSVQSVPDAPGTRQEPRRALQDRKNVWEPIIRQEATKWGLSDKKTEELVSTALCESGMNPDAWNRSDPNGGSRGIFQFQSGTFYANAPLAGIQNPMWTDPYQQVTVATYMFSVGKETHWSCWWLNRGQTPPWW